MAQTAERKKTKAGLPSGSAREAKEAVTQTTTPESLSGQCKIHYKQNKWARAENSGKRFHPRLLCDDYDRNLASSCNIEVAVQLANWIIYWQDRNIDSGKCKGGELSMFINNNWCTQTGVYIRPDANISSCNIPYASRAALQPHIGQSDHLSLHLITAYKPLRRK